MSVTVARWHSDWACAVPARGNPKRIESIRTKSSPVFIAPLLNGISGKNDVDAYTGIVAFQQ